MTKRLRVIYIITCLSTGGAQRALYNILAGGLAQRYESAVISLRDVGTLRGHIQALDVPVHTLDVRRGSPNLRALRRLRSVAREFRPNVVQGWMYHGNLAASISARMAGRRPRVVWNVRHSLDGLDEEKALTRWMIRAGRRFSSDADAILYNSRVSREQHEAFGFNGARARVIPNGFDLAQFGPKRVTYTKVRRELGIPESVPVIGHVARFHSMKNHASFLRAAARVANDMPRAEFLLVGDGVHPENPALTGIVPAVLLNRFHFAGERPDVPDIMQAMDVLCSSSWSEAFPNVLGEAMACRIPCVVTDVGDSAEIVGDTGIAVPPGDDKALAAGLLTMLTNTEGQRRALGRSARERVETHYRLDRVVEQYARLYEQLNSGARSHHERWSDAG